MPTPKVFISHASEDKDRFVVEFAEKLRSHGVDAWLDKWEMLPGDSLVDKIFEEGIKNASAFLIILSSVSTSKGWVREELNAGVVKRIESGTKLIPVVIDDCTIPESLKSTVWIRISDLNKYDSEMSQILQSIYGHYDKPALGAPPPYAASDLLTIPSLTPIDSIVLKLSCERALTTGHKTIETANLWIELESHGATWDDYTESLEILNNRGFIDATRSINGQLFLFQITPIGFDAYAGIYQDDYEETFELVKYTLINEDLDRASLISEHIDKNELIVKFILETLQSRGLINAVYDISGSLHILSIKPELRRMARR